MLKLIGRVFHRQDQGAGELCEIQLLDGCYIGGVANVIEEWEGGVEPCHVARSDDGADRGLVGMISLKNALSVRQRFKRGFKSRCSTMAMRSSGVARKRSMTVSEC